MNSIMEVVGKTTINPILFYTGKVAGFVTWLAWWRSTWVIVSNNQIFYNHQIARIFLAGGLIFIIVSLLNLGKSVRVGLPSDQTTFKSHGIYKISRNPMYVGLHLVTLSSMIFSLNWIIIIMGIYSFVIYHFIIKGEEKFLKNRFGESYLEYQRKVRRYF
jgi:protein-S-isoprenylcysteine O-methyltransferase Ste14